MSHAHGQCRFDADGLILHCEYNGTADIMERALWPTRAEMWAHWREFIERKCTCGRDEPVRLATNYGGAFHWPGRACRHCMAVTAGTDPYPSDETGAYSPITTDGAPDWWPDAAPSGMRERSP